MIRGLALLLALITLPATAGELWMELGVGHDESTTANPHSVVRLRYEVITPWWAPDVLEWDHHSSIANGRPFNHRAEDSIDQFSIIWRLRIWK